MMEVDEFIQDYLIHYANPNYDPAKRREYYLRTRKLKGRDGGRNVEVDSSRGSRLRSSPRRPVKNLESDKNDFENRIQALQAHAQERMREISNKIRKFVEQKQIRIDDKTQAKIDALPKIPKNASAETKARLAEFRRQEIAQIRATGAQEKATTSQNATERLDAARKRVVQDLRAAIEKARGEYQRSARDIVAQNRSRLQSTTAPKGR
jgi:hypothetical protein